MTKNKYNMLPIQKTTKETNSSKILIKSGENLVQVVKVTKFCKYKNIYLNINDSDTTKGYV